MEMCSRLQSWWARQRNRCYRVSRCQDTRPDKTASAECGDYENWKPGTRHRSLPRSLLCNFSCERSLNEQVEQQFLKHFLKEHGLYNKHQTLEQRRRLKQLLELEERTVRVPGAKGDDAPQADVFSVLHSLTPKSNTPNQSCSIELHSTPFRDPEPILFEQPNNSFASRRVSSLPELAVETCAKDPQPNGEMASQPNISLEGQRMARETWERILVWKTFVQGTTQPYLETEI